MREGGTAPNRVSAWQVARKQLHVRKTTGGAHVAELGGLRYPLGFQRVSDIAGAVFIACQIAKVGPLKASSQDLSRARLSGGAGAQGASGISRVHRACRDLQEGALRRVARANVGLRDPGGLRRRRCVDRDAGQLGRKLG